MTEWIVYECFDSDGELIYVGSTGRGLARRKVEHRTDSPWFSLVARWEIRAIARSKDEAREMEDDVIATRSPRFNKIRARVGRGMPGGIDVGRAKALRAEGLTMRQIAAELDTYPVKVWRALR